jgi:hypothetical protein
LNTECREKKCYPSEDEIEDDYPFPFTEVALVATVEEFLIFHWDWVDLWAFISADLLRKFLWLTDDTFIAVGNAVDHFDGDPQYDTLLLAYSTETSGQVQRLTLIKERDADVSTGARQCFLASDRDK